jgi:hypothetical protein
MLNMTIEQFEEKLEELLDLYKQLIEKQKGIRCKATGDNILCYEADTLLTFANKKQIPVSVIRDDKAVEACRYEYKISCREVELIGFSTNKAYMVYKERGLVS